MDRVAREGISDAELLKARNIMSAGFWRGMATIDGKASALGNAEVFLGDYQRAFSLPDEIDAVTAAQVQDVAKKVFDRRKMTVGVLRSPQAEGAQ